MRCHAGALVDLEFPRGVLETAEVFGDVRISHIIDGVAPLYSAMVVVVGGTFRALGWGDRKSQKTVNMSGE